MATFLSATNSVLKRLREATVTTVSQNDYSTLIGEWINDALREVQDAWDWTALRQEITVTTVVGTTDYTIPGTNERTRVPFQINQTDQSFLLPIKSEQYLYLTKLGTAQATSPIYFRFRGWNPTGLLEIQVYPKPDAADALIFECIVPQAELTADATVITVPSWLVVQRALVDALDERGDDGGQTIRTRMEKYRHDLQEAIAFDSGRAHREVNWEVA